MRRAILAFVLLLACREQRTQAEQAHARATVGASAVASATCPTHFSDARIDADSIAGLSTHATIAILRAQCPSARIDTTTVGGTEDLALRFDAPGVTIWAMQTANDALDSLRGNQPADLWAATGDSLRFADGHLIPMHVGSLRMLDSIGIVDVEHGDDIASRIVRCRYPWISFVVDNMWPTFADSGIVALVRVSPRDTTAVWRVELSPTQPDSVDVRQCRQLKRS